MTLGTVLLLSGAGFAAGALNAVAGGGSLVSFPALLAAGLTSLPANVTNTVALWPGYAGGVVGYRRELLRLRSRLLDLGVVSLVGAIAGAVLLLSTPATSFRSFVPWLVLLGTLLFAVQPVVAGRVLVRRAAGGGTHRRGWLRVGILLASVYGAYFGAGVGVMLLAILGIFESDDLQDLNAQKNALSLSTNTVALVAFALFGPVRWLAVLVMAVASLAGGYLGAVSARRLPAQLVRSGVIVIGVLVAAKLFAQR